MQSAVREEKKNINRITEKQQKQYLVHPQLKKSIRLQIMDIMLETDAYKRY
jgi:hypothetical protein